MFSSYLLARQSCKCEEVPLISSHVTRVCIVHICSPGVVRFPGRLAHSYCRIYFLRCRFGGAVAAAATAERAGPLRHFSDTFFSPPGSVLSTPTKSFFELISPRAPSRPVSVRVTFRMRIESSGIGSVYFTHFVRRPAESSRLHLRWGRRNYERRRSAG